MTNCHASRQTNVPPLWGLVSVLLITCHSIILQCMLLFSITRALNTAWMNFDAFAYTFFLRWKNASKIWKSSFLLMIDLLAFRAQVRLFESSFKLLYCYMYFVICSLQITHFYRMFLSEFLTLQKTCTHPTQFEWIIYFIY